MGNQDDSVSRTIAVGDFPNALTFDGHNVWVANGIEDTVTKIRFNDGFVLGTFQWVQSAQQMVFDGVNVWIVNGVSMVKIFPNDVSKSQSITMVGSSAIAFDGQNIWVTNSTNNTVTKINPADLSILAAFDTGPAPYAVGFDGANIWVASSTGRSVARF